MLACASVLSPEGVAYKRHSVERIEAWKLLEQVEKAPQRGCAHDVAQQIRDAGVEGKKAQTSEAAANTTIPRPKTGTGRRRATNAAGRRRARGQG